MMKIIDCKYTKVSKKQNTYFLSHKFARNSLNEECERK